MLNILWSFIKISAELLAIKILVLILDLFFRAQLDKFALGWVDRKGVAQIVDGR